MKQQLKNKTMKNTMYCKKIYLDYTDKDYNDIVIDVTYDFYLGTEGDWDVQGTPDIVEIESVINTNTNKEIIETLSSAELEWIEDEILQTISE